MESAANLVKIGCQIKKKVVLIRLIKILTSNKQMEAAILNTFKMKFMQSLKMQ